MKVLIVLTIIACISSRGLLKPETVEDIKSKASWETYDWDENPFKDYSHDEIHAIFGATLMWDEHNIPMLIDEDDHSEILPEEFDSRKQWPDCVFPVRDQQHCGSCWAFSAAEVLTDRFCIKSQGKIKEVLSPQDFVSCNTDNHGCHGGQLDVTWDYLETTGITTDQCTPYVSGDGKNVPHCSHGVCADGQTKYTKYRVVLDSSKSLTSSSQIKKEIIANGPVQTGFIVYEDFMHYKGGIYKHTSGNQLGGHAVKIVGWGKEEDKEYWIAQNSWGPNWAENGYFRIAFGECLFDSNGYAGGAKIDDFSLIREFKY
jgi:cathepsin B